MPRRLTEERDARRDDTCDDARDDDKTMDIAAKALDSVFDGYESTIDGCTRERGRPRQYGVQRRTRCRKISSVCRKRKNAVHLPRPKKDDLRELRSILRMAKGIIADDETKAKSPTSSIKPKHVDETEIAQGKKTKRYGGVETTDTPPGGIDCHSPLVYRAAHDDGLDKDPPIVGAKPVNAGATYGARDPPNDEDQAEPTQDSDKASRTPATELDCQGEASEPRSTTTGRRIRRGSPAFFAASGSRARQAPCAASGRSRPHLGSETRTEAMLASVVPEAGDEGSRANFLFSFVPPEVHGECSLGEMQTSASPAIETDLRYGTERCSHSEGNGSKQDVPPYGGRSCTESPLRGHHEDSLLFDRSKLCWFVVPGFKRRRARDTEKEQSAECMRDSEDRIIPAHQPGGPRPIGKHARRREGKRHGGRGRCPRANSAQVSGISRRDGRPRTSGDLRRGGLREDETGSVAIGAEDDRWPRALSRASRRRKRKSTPGAKAIRGTPRMVSTRKYGGSNRCKTDLGSFFLNSV